MSTSKTAPTALGAALARAIASLEAAAQGAKDDLEQRGERAGAEELLDWGEEIEAALREVATEMRSDRGGTPHP